MDIKKVYGKGDTTMGETTLLWDYEDTLCGTGHIRFLYLSHATGHNGTGTIRCWFWVTVWASPAMDCDVNTYAPEGQPMYTIVDELAADNEFFAETFLDGWQQMTSNGYTEDELVDGPQNSWIGHYSLTQQGVDVGDFESFITENAPVTFTDATVRSRDKILDPTILCFQVDPYICGHLGHFLVSCQNKFSTCYENGYCPANN